MRRHLNFILIFSGVIFIFLGRLIFMRAGFIDGDYLTQFYPWSLLYSQVLKKFTFPFWTRYFHSGFPLMAEGQIGGFYPLNIIMFFLFPFKVTYNYSVILHFILGGFFTYLYCRKIGTDQGGATLGSILFCFGSAYAGCFYNTVTLKVCVWFPLVLFFLEKYFENRRLIYLIIGGFLLGMQFLAGFFQMAFYSAIFYFIYFISGLFIHRKFSARDIVNLTVFFFIAGIMFLPQFVLSFGLLRLSSRAHPTLGFSLWGSFLPFNLISIFFPYLVFYGAKFYISVFGLLFLIVSFYFLRGSSQIKPLFILLLSSLFLALGKFNPLYVEIIKLTHLYGFRNPSKFIFFGVFSGAVLSAWGWTNFFCRFDSLKVKKALKIFTVVVSIGLIIFGLFKISLYLFKTQIIKLGQWYVRNFIFGKPHHRYSLSHYLEKVRGFYNTLVEISGPNVFMVSSLIFCFIALFFSLYLLKKRKFNLFFLKIFMGLLIFVDLFIFSFYGTGFRGNIKDFTKLSPTHTKILNFLKEEKTLFRILPLGLVEPDMPYWTRPNSNILFRIDSVSAYTPLALDAYYKELRPLEVVDNSLGLAQPKLSALSTDYEILRILNVKYLITPYKLNLPSLKKEVEDTGVFLYRLEDWLPRAFFSPSIDDFSFASKEKVKIISYEEGLAYIEAESSQAGYLIFSETFFPGWKAYIDGRKTSIIPVKGIIQAVKLPRGKHSVVFRYRPFRVFK